MNMFPIAFSDEMINACRAGRKTVTRRVSMKNRNRSVWRRRLIAGQINQGQRLWVQECFNDDWCDHTLYRADGGSARSAGYKNEPKWRPSTNMPWFRSRAYITLIEDAHEEHLQYITKEDMIAEGADAGKFPTLWDKIYGAGSWNDNPLVIVMRFRWSGVNKPWKCLRARRANGYPR